MPVDLNPHAAFQSVRQTIKCIKSCSYKSMFKHQNGETCDLTDFDPGMLLVPDMSDYVFQKTLDYAAPQSMHFTQSYAKNKNYPESGSSLCGNAFLMREVKKEWPDLFGLNRR